MAGATSTVLMLNAALVLLVQGQQSAEPTSQPEPASRPALERPAQAEIYRELLEDMDRPARILPRDVRQEQPGAGAADAAQRGDLMLEGQVLFDLPGQLVLHEDRAEFRFHSTEEREGVLKSLELLKNEWLELMEREAEAGVTDFYITAMVTRYRGENFLLVQKVRRQIGHGNLGP